MPFSKGASLISYAIKKEEENKVFMQWVQHLPFMSMKYIEYVPFERYLDKVTGRNIDRRTNEDIIADIEKAHGIHIEVENGNI